MPFQKIKVAEDEDQATRPCLQVSGVGEEEHETFVNLVQSIGEELKVKLFVARLPSRLEVQFARDSPRYPNEPQVMRDVLSLVCRRFE